MATSDEMMRALVGLDANPNNYTMADILGYAAPLIPPPQPSGPNQEKRLEPPQETRFEPSQETRKVPPPEETTRTYAPVNDTGRVNPNKVAAPSYITG